jgi:hypothetical protein
MTGFFPHTSFELRDCHLVNEGHLALEPIAERISWKGVRVENDQLVGVDLFPNCHETLHKVIKDTFVLDERAVGVHIKAIKALYK